MKKIISAVAVTAIAATMSAPAFAVLTPDGEPVIQGDIMLLSEGTEVGEGVEVGEVEAVDGEETPDVIGEDDAKTPIIILPGQTAVEPKYTKTEVEVSAVVADDEAQSIIYTVDEDEVEVSLEEAVILGIDGEVKEFSDIEEGAKLFVFNDKDAESEAPAYVVILDEEVAVNVNVDGFTASETLGEYVDTQNFLAITLSEDTEIVDIEGNELTAEDVADKYLMVFYDKMTMSIPAITNPLKVIVLGDYEPVEESEATPEPTEEPEYEYEISVDKNDVIVLGDITEGEISCIPVRKYAEGIGLEVNWDGTDKSVTVGTEQMGVGFKIGDNSYSKVKMTPFVLEVAPQLINGTTYVPVSFFEQVIEAKVTIAE